MTSRPTLPPELETWLADHPELSPGELASPWRLAEGANPLDAAPAPDPARIEAIEAALAQAAVNGAAPRPALRLVKSARPVYWMAAAACIAETPGMVSTSGLAPSHPLAVNIWNTGPDMPYTPASPDDTTATT